MTSIAIANDCLEQKKYKIVIKWGKFKVKKKSVKERQGEQMSITLYNVIGSKSWC